MTPLIQVGNGNERVKGEGKDTMAVSVGYGIRLQHELFSSTCVDTQRGFLAVEVRGNESPIKSRGIVPNIYIFFLTQTQIIK
jgi:hypothetical protein